MALLLTFIVCLLIGQSLSIGVGLLVERYSTPYTGLVTFIVCYFAMFWGGLAPRSPHHRTAVAPGGGMNGTGRPQTNGRPKRPSLPIARAAHRQLGQGVSERGALLACRDADLVERLHVFAVEGPAAWVVEGRVHIGDAQRDPVSLRGGMNQHHLDA